MSDYTPFSELVDGDEKTFDELWDEVTSNSSSKSETKEESLIPLGIASLPEPEKEPEPEPEPTPILERLPKRKYKRDEITISTIEAEDQTIVSAISKTSLRDRAAGCFDMPSVLLETSSLDRELSEITDLRIEKQRPKAKKTERVSFNLLESCTGDQPLEMPSCIGKKTCGIPKCVSAKCAQYPSIADAYSPSLFESIYEEDENPEIPNQEKTPIDLKESIGSKPETKPTSSVSTDTVTTAKVEPTSAAFNICFSGVDPITSISEFFASASSHFNSSSLSVDGDCSVLFAGAQKDAAKKTDTVPTVMSALTMDSPKSLREQIERVDRNLLDCIMTSSAASDDRSTTTIEENITEGLGLDLPPTPVLERPTTKISVVVNPTPEAIKAEDSQDLKTSDSDSATNMATIEVNTAGNVLLEDSMNRNVHLSHKIEVETDDASTTESPESEESTAPIVHPNTPSPQRKAFKPRWPKLFSSKEKKDKKNKNHGIVKPSKTISDSPGSATVGTAETQMTMMTYATLNFAEDHPVNPKKHPFFLRPRASKA